MPKELKTYRIEYSMNSLDWRLAATFTEGEASRWGTEFDADTALKEAKGYRATWAKDKKPFVRVIIEL